MVNGTACDLEPLAGVRVSIASLGIETSTDENGHFSLSGLRAPADVRIDVDAIGLEGTSDRVFSTTQLPAHLFPDRTTTVAARLIEGCALVRAQTPGSLLGLSTLDCGLVQAESGRLEVSIAEGDLVDSTGAVWSGDVAAVLVPIGWPSAPDNSQDLSGLLAMPGDMTASPTAGGVSLLESVGTGEIRLRTPSGDRLQVAPNRTVTIRVFPTTSVSPSDGFTTWRFEPTTGRWVEGEPGVMLIGRQGSWYEIEAPHLSWWNVDRSLAETGCVRGMATTTTDALTTEPQVRALGIEAGFSSVKSGAAFCFDTMPSSPIHLLAEAATMDGRALRVRHASATSSAAGSSCANPSSCTDVGTLILEPVLTACHAGLAETPGGQPYEGPISLRFSGTVPGDGTRRADCTLRNAAIGVPANSTVGGNFCLEAPALGTATALDQQGCRADIQLAATSTPSPAAACGLPGTGGTDCADLGTLSFYCGS